jgi:hypothetical protein
LHWADPQPDPQVVGDIEYKSGAIAPEETGPNIQSNSIPAEFHAEEPPSQPPQIGEASAEPFAIDTPAEEGGFKESLESISAPHAAAPVNVAGDPPPIDPPWAETISLVEGIPERMAGAAIQSDTPAPGGTVEELDTARVEEVKAPKGVEITEEPAILVEVPPRVLPAIQNAKHGRDDGDVPTAPGKYRLRARSSATRESIAQRQKSAQQPRAGEERVSLSIHVRLLFETGGFCAVTLMPERHPSMSEEMTVKSHPIEGKGHAEKLFLTALSENWFQDLSHSSLGRMLSDGAIWSSRHEAKRFRWSLSRHQLYVLGPRTDLTGFVSITRLVLGQTHVVLCVDAMREQVIKALGEAGAEGFTLLPTDYGTPAGWLAIRDVTPKRAVPAGTDELLNPLRPLPDIEIVLDGGIRLLRSNYLAGFPPSIRLRGQRDENTLVFIDGSVAVERADGSFTREGWDSLGAHTIFCAGNQTYTIEEAELGWEDTECEGGDSDGLSDRLRVSGAFIRAAGNGPALNQFVSAPAGSPLLIGAVPGEIFLCDQARTRSAHLGFAPFAPVWAIPADPLHANKETSRVRLLGKPVPVAVKHVRGKRAIERVHAWCNAILNCGRKNLSIEPERPNVRGLWNNYCRVARKLRRAIK